MAATGEVSRIDHLDVLRGIAILGILFINLPGAATYYAAFFGLEFIAGWTVADRAAWMVMEVLIDGTQRGLLQLLFGAGMLLLTARAMTDDGPVRVADIYYRRNLWLMLFGLANVFLLLFPGDILFIYAIAALVIFPFRRLSPKALLAIGLVWVAYSTVSGAVRYAERAELQQQVETAQARAADGLAAASADRAALGKWQELEKGFRPNPEELKADRDKRLGPFLDYARYSHDIWIDYRAGTLGLFYDEIPEAIAWMLIGAALFKLGIIQGARTRRFYLVMALAAYALGLGLRMVEVQQHLTYAPGPRVVWFTEEIARLAMTLGHLALVNLAMTSSSGRTLLAPLRAAGRTAFSLYVMQTLLTIWLLFPGFGLGLFGQLGWAGMFATALAIILLQLLLANLWLRAFRMGPVEWAWRSLVMVERQPFRRHAAPAAGGPE